jgi:4-cresol dehydrogenase (hydroxylating)
VVPNTGEHALAVAGLVDRLLLEHGFEPQMSISLATERTLVCVITISYDRQVDGEDERAMACYQALSNELLARGYPPYRLSLARMAAGGGETYQRLLEVLKGAVDPRGILAPGRYGTRGSAS